VDAVMNESIDLVVTVCDNARKLAGFPQDHPGDPHAFPRPSRRAVGKLCQSAGRDSGETGAELRQRFPLANVSCPRPSEALNLKTALTAEDAEAAEENQK